MITRRSLLRGLGAFLVGATGLSGYAVGIEPFRLVETRYRLALPGWPRGLRLTIAVLADVHACEPWMTPAHIRSIVEAINALKPDVTLLLGDYTVAHGWTLGRVEPRAWAAVLGELKAPLGVHAVLGNHDWWGDPVAQARGHGPTVSQLALEAAGVRMYENQVVRLEKNRHPFWIAGLGDQYAIRRVGAAGLFSRGVDDLSGTLAQVRDDAPVLLMAHEPDIFSKVPPRVALTIAGHTHGGQIRVFGRVPFTPYGGPPEPYSYGHFVERRPTRFAGAERHLIVSGGLGCSVVPLRFGVPPEVVILELGGDSFA